MEHKTKLLIIGSGPAGYTAAIYAVRSGLEPILVTGTQTGGQLTITNEIENFPGFPEVISGFELMQRMRSQAENLGVKIVEDTISKVDFSDRPFICSAESGNTFVAGAIIIATGAGARLLGLDSEKKFLGFGVSACATCDGFFYRNKNVAVVGGGNSAVTEALHLAKIANSVTLIHRRDSLRAEDALQKKLLQNKKITIEWNSSVEEILGTDTPLSVNGIRIKNLQTNQTKDLNVDGVFVAIGRSPKTELFKNQLNIDSRGYIITKTESTQTSVEGVFAAGDVKSSRYQQAIMAAGSGCLAALEADDFLNK